MRMAMIAEWSSPTLVFTRVGLSAPEESRRTKSLLRSVRLQVQVVLRRRVRRGEHVLVVLSDVELDRSERSVGREHERGQRGVVAAVTRCRRRPAQMSSVTPSRPVLAGKFTARPEITIGSRWGTMSTTSGAVADEELVLHRERLLRRRGLHVGLSGQHLLVRGEARHAALRRARRTVDRHVLRDLGGLGRISSGTSADTNVPRECPTRYTCSTPNSASVASITSATSRRRSRRCPCPAPSCSNATIRSAG